MTLTYHGRELRRRARRTLKNKPSGVNLLPRVVAHSPSRNRAQVQRVGGCYEHPTERQVLPFRLQILNRTQTGYRMAYSLQVYIDDFAGSIANSSLGNTCLTANARLNEQQALERNSRTTPRFCDS